MDVYALLKAIYWLLGIFAVIIFFVTVWQVRANKLMALGGFRLSSFMAWGGCLSMIASIVCPVIWLAVAVLGGFALYGIGMAIEYSVIVAVLFAVAYVVGVFLASLVSSIICYVFAWVYYRISFMAKKIRLKRSVKQNK